MREIKFRVWDKKLDCMTYPPSSISSSLGPFFMTLDGRIYIDGVYHDFELMQYTGLKDKNGKEIYEGDIVKHVEDTHWSSFVNEDTRVTVAYSTEGAFFEPFSGSDYSWNPKEIEVIGNCFENPELLK